MTGEGRAVGVKHYSDVRHDVFFAVALDFFARLHDRVYEPAVWYLVVFGLSQLALRGDVFFVYRGIKGLKLWRDEANIGVFVHLIVHHVAAPRLADIAQHRC